MAKLHLSFAMGENLRSRPILDGSVQPEGIELHCSRLPPPELFWRQLEFHEFQASEMSISSLTIARSHGDDTFVGLPIFTTRTFFHTGIMVRTAADIGDPSQLAGKRMAVPEYQQTGALWARGILEHEFGVDPKSMTWFMERLPERSHGGATGFVPPPGIDLTYIPPESSIGQMFEEGEVDASIMWNGNAPGMLNRNTARSGGSSIRPLFRDRAVEGGRYFAKTGVFPINHCVVVRKDVVDQYPWVPLNLYQAFVEAKRRQREEFQRALEPLRLTGMVGESEAADLERDVFPYGVRDQRSVLELIPQYSFEQGLTSRPLGLEEIFYPPTLEL
jgi:4,5-dihydroxyphthalate decarboxylase